MSIKRSKQNLQKDNGHKVRTLTREDLQRPHKAIIPSKGVVDDRNTSDGQMIGY